jgi:hypothetical protein
MTIQNFDYKKQWPITALLSLIAVLLIVLVFRGGNTGPSTKEILGTSQAMAGTMVAVQLTEVAAVGPSATAPIVDLLPSATPEAPRDTPTTYAEGECYSMQLTDENLPDGTIVNPGESIVKTWLLTNTGTCTWTEEYALVFHHGDDMEANNFTNLAGWVLPGESVWVELDMIAPFQPGSHIGFWAMQSPDGTVFGPGSTGTFWVRVAIAGPTPASRARGFDSSSGGAIRSDGQPDNTIKTGDNTSNLDWQGLVTYKFGNLSENSTVTGVVLDFSVDFSIEGDPFTTLGCLNVFPYSYGGIDASDYGSATGFALWTFCSEADLAGGARFGGPAAIDAVDTALFANTIQLILVFDNQTNLDGINDIVISDPALTISFYDN